MNIEVGYYDGLPTSLKEDTGLYFYEKMTEPKIYHLIFAFFLLIIRIRLLNFQ